MKTTLITTVRNEEDSIDDYLDSVIKQTKKTDEIIIVDGQSTDNTLKKILEFQKRNKNLKLKVLRKKGNIATGRNFAIKNSTGEIILCSDSGCLLHKNWIKEMIDGFTEHIDVVAGYYKPTFKNIFEECLATYTSVMPDKIDSENFLPSSRSVGFKKSAWKKVGGYPQWLDTCEDLYFARALKSKGFKFRFTKKAIVYWPQRKNILEAFQQFYSYAKGDGTARYIRPQTPFLFARYTLGLILVLIAYYAFDLLFVLIAILLVCYALWAILKNYKYIGKWQAIIYLPALQFTADLAVLTGMSTGLIKSFIVKRA